MANNNTLPLNNNIANAGEIKSNMPTLSAEIKAPQQTNGSNISISRRCIETLCIYVGAFMIGCCIAIFGPTLVHISLLYDTSIGTLSRVFLFYNVGFFLGSLATGLIFDRINWHLLNFAAFVILGLSIGGAPLMPTIFLYQASSARLIMFIIKSLYKHIPYFIF